MSNTTTDTRTGTVYVIGAGFSAALGYPLVNDLLIRLWEWGNFPETLRSSLHKVIAFHHPGFDPDRRTSFPNIEQLLSEMMVNEDLFDASRSAPGRFSFEQLVDIRRELLQVMADWFHSIYKLSKKDRPVWLETFKNLVKPEDTLMSFNWDLVLEHLIYGTKLCGSSYGFGHHDPTLPLLVKPHGSLNWFDPGSGTKIKEEKRFELTPKSGSSFVVFKRFRAPSSKVGRTYMPMIVPPIFNKTFHHEIFRESWQTCVARISVARKVVFLGYSLPEADLHGRFILRCGFHNQADGVPTPNGRATPTGKSEAIVVNPDRASATRIEGVVGKDVRCTWEPTLVQNWIEKIQA